MSITTFVTEADFITPDNDAIREWLVQAENALGKKIAVKRARVTNSWWRRKWSTPSYTVMIYLGAGQAQIVNFSPRDVSTWSINTSVPAQEVAAWLMGIVAGHNAALAGGKK